MAVATSPRSDTVTFDAGLPAVIGDAVVGVASLRRRSLAWAVDLVLLFFATILVGTIVDPSGTNEVVDGAVVGGGALFVPIYFAICEGPWGQTLGKWALRIAVRDAETFAPVGLGRAVVRSAVRVGCWLFVFVGAPVADAVPALRDKTFRRAWHDRKAGTVVVAVAPVPRPARPRSALWSAVRALLVVSWAAIAVSVFFEPAPNPDAAQPRSSAVLFGAYAAVLIAAAVLGGHGRWRSGLSCAVAAGAIGLVVSYQCAATSHHPQGWWIYELAAFGYLTALSAASLPVRARAG